MVLFVIIDPVKFEIVLLLALIVLLVRVPARERPTKVSVAAGRVQLDVESAPVAGVIFTLPLVAFFSSRTPTTEPAVPRLRVPPVYNAAALDVHPPEPLSVKICVADPDVVHPDPPLTAAHFTP